MNNKAVELSQKLLFAIKQSEEPYKYIIDLAEYPMADLKQELSNDAITKAFWINIYNAFSTYLLHPNPKIILTQAGRIKHFNDKTIIIAGQPLSLNEIEHGILRKSKVWWSKGYLSKLWVKGFEKEFRVREFDNRIHFALNCGGESCPPIRFYSPEQIEEQLQMATLSFLEGETSYDKSTDTVTTSPILKWYIGDFNGSMGIIKLLKMYEVIPQDISPKLEYKDYSWEAKVRFMT